jgi:hypothetical protein
MAVTIEKNRDGEQKAGYTSEQCPGPVDAHAMELVIQNVRSAEEASSRELRSGKDEDQDIDIPYIGRTMGILLRPGNVTRYLQQRRRRH